LSTGELSGTSTTTSVLAGDFKDTVWTVAEGTKAMVGAMLSRIAIELYDTEDSVKG